VFRDGERHLVNSKRPIPVRAWRVGIRDQGGLADCVKVVAAVSVTSSLIHGKGHFSSAAAESGDSGEASAGVVREFERVRDKGRHGFPIEAKEPVIAAVDARAASLRRAVAREI